MLSRMQRTRRSYILVQTPTYPRPSNIILNCTRPRGSGLRHSSGKGYLVLTIKDVSLINMSGNKDIVQQSEEDTDIRPPKPRWLSVRDLNFNAETMFWLEKYTKLYTDIYRMTNDAVTWLEMMRGYAIMHSHDKIDPTKHVSCQVSFDLHQICKYELPAKHEIHMLSAIGMIINDNFYREKERIARQKTLSEIYKQLALADSVIRAWYTDTVKNEKTNGKRVMQESVLAEMWYPSDYVVTTGKQSKAPENVDWQYTVENVYDAYADNMGAALAFLKEYLKEGGVASIPMIEATRQAKQGADPKAPFLEDPTTDAEQAEMRSLLARLTQRYGGVMRD